MAQKTTTKANDKLTSQGLTSALWDTLQRLQKGEIEPQEANAIAAQSREIIRVVRTEIVAQSALRNGEAGTALGLLGFGDKTKIDEVGR